MSFKKFISNLLFPKNIKCIVCGDELNCDNDYCICEKCNCALPWNNQHFCARCGNPLKSLSNYCVFCKKEQPEFDCARAPLIFKEKIVVLIHNLKYNNSKFIATCFSKMLYDEFLKTDWQVDLVCPVPLFVKREKQRGYNQSELLCDEFKKNGFVVDKTNLVRVKNTQTQTELTYKERQENLENAFKVIDKSKIKGKTILLIDDVFTTGSTLKHCSKELKKAGAIKVYCLTIAHVENFKMAEGEQNVKN